MSARWECWSDLLPRDIDRDGEGETPQEVALGFVRFHVENGTGGIIEAKPDYVTVTVCDTETDRRWAVRVRLDWEVSLDEGQELEVEELCAR